MSPAHPCCRGGLLSCSDHKGSSVPHNLHSLRGFAPANSMRSPHVRHTATPRVSLLGASHSYSRWTDRSIHLCSKTVRATFMAHGSSVMRPLSSGIHPAVEYSRSDLRSDGSRLPLAGHRSLTLSRGSSASPALLRPITCTSPSARQPIRGVTPGLRFLRDPSQHAMRLAPAHVDA